MAKYLRVRGTLDYFENDAELFSYIESKVYEVTKKFNLKKIITPTFEQTSLFVRSTGESSDIVNKEMYSFKDKSDRDITLRPEGTAGVIRAVIENKLYVNDLPLKYYYFGPFFRYERPQVGRYREFYQFGVEYVGSNSYLDDVECILLVKQFLEDIGVKDFKIRINTFGNPNCLVNYRNDIKGFFNSHLDNLCEDCKNRFNTNPLRILDCKIDKDYFLNLDVPSTHDSLDENANSEYEMIKELLQVNGVSFEEDKYLVRGLDYYTGLIFEVDYTTKDGKTLTIGGGGRYSSLVKELDGPDLNCVGFGLGASRIALVLDDIYGKASYANSVDYYIMPFDEKAIVTAFKVATALRSKGNSVVIETNKKSIGSMFKFASKNNFKKAIMIGEDELKENKVKIKDLSTQEQYFEDIDKILGE